VQDQKDILNGELSAAASGDLPLYTVNCIICFDDPSMIIDPHSSSEAIIGPFLIDPLLLSVFACLCSNYLSSADHP